jgi:uncharacterized protein (DUF1499 family)
VTSASFFPDKHVSKSTWYLSISDPSDHPESLTMMLPFKVFFVVVIHIACFSTAVHSFGIDPSSTSYAVSRRTLLQPSETAAIHVLGIALATSVLPSFPTAAVAASSPATTACPPKSQNCLRTTWTVPNGGSKTAAAVLDLFQSYPQEGQADVDKGGWTVVENTGDSFHVEFQSGVGNFAKFFNGGKPFVDDVWVQVLNDGATVEIKSSSRVGESDLGVNQKRLQYLAAKARGLGWEAPNPVY